MVELHEYDDIIKRLVSVAEHQRVIVDDLRNVVAQQTTINRRLEETSHDIRTFVQQQGVVNAQNTALVLRIARTLVLIDEKLGQILHPPRSS
jgi:hypothetical protein